ncbi:ABC transporter substrate-binding protein [Falsiroseomonas sp. HW251]|uniref:ABC transporter substrate-binding protein n=1 Tax=Falsiroseomonas sp. HW251 TaxID=3390998 RepID=UPI003D323F35
MIHPTRRELGIAAASLALLRPLARPALAQGAKEVLTFAAVTFAEAGRGERLRAWLDRFNRSQDRIEVQPVALPFATLANTVFTQMGGGGGPDLVRFDQIDYHAAVPANRLLQLDELIDMSAYPMAATDRYMKIGGKRYGVVFEGSNYVLLYNPTLLRGGAAPADFDNFLETAKAATGNGVYGFAYRATMAERPGFWQDICNFVFGFGGRWSDGTTLTLDAPGVVAGVAAYKRVYDSGAIPRGADAATFRRMFWEGKLAMEVDNGGVAGILKQQAPDLPLAAAPSPFPTRAQGMVLAPLTINANTKNRAAAVSFVKWVLQPDVQAELQPILGASSVATTVPRTAEAVAAQPWLTVYDEQTPNSLPQLVEGLETRTPEIQQIVLEQVLRVLQANRDPGQAMADAQREALRRLRR